MTSKISFGMLDGSVSRRLVGKILSSGKDAFTKDIRCLFLETSLANHPQMFSIGLNSLEHTGRSKKSDVVVLEEVN